ncbi:MAG: L-fuconolactonase, partial [Flavobacteriaceae bacterium]
MRVDSHQHFWNFNSDRDSWIDDSMVGIRKNFLPKDLSPILTKNSMNCCVAIQANQSEEETFFLLNLAKQHSFIKGVIGWVDLCANNVKERIAFFAKNKALKGFRHIVQAEKEDFLLRKDFQNGIYQLSQFKLTYDLLVLPNQLKLAIKLVTQFPDQVFILDHIAKPKISEPIDDQWKHNIKALAAFTNVCCK